MSECPWCGHPTCVGDQPRHPHHSLCCTDGSRRECWAPHPHIGPRDVDQESLEGDG